MGDVVGMRDGNVIPQLGFGVFQVPLRETAAAVEHALRTGYRHIDTAAAYHNEVGVAQAIAALDDVSREEVFVTTKLWNADHGHDRALRAFDRSFGALGGGYIDLYLIHWPVPSAGRYAETWRALVELQAAGRVRSIGVSNFGAEHLQEVIDATGVVPAINQVELHAEFQQRALRRYHAEHGILTEAWAPLGQGRSLANPVIGRIAEQHGRTPAQVLIRWHLQLGNVVIPKSVTPARIEENFDVFGFTLSDDDMAAIEALDTGHRIGPDPATFAMGA